MQLMEDRQGGSLWSNRRMAEIASTLRKHLVPCKSALQRRSLSERLVIDECFRDCPNCASDESVSQSIVHTISKPARLTFDVGLILFFDHSFAHEEANHSSYCIEDKDD